MTVPAMGGTAWFSEKKRGDISEMYSMIRKTPKKKNSLWKKFSLFWISLKLHSRYSEQNFRNG